MGSERKKKKNIATALGARCLLGKKNTERNRISHGQLNLLLVVRELLPTHNLFCGAHVIGTAVHCSAGRALATDFSNSRAADFARACILSAGGAIHSD